MKMESWLGIAGNQLGVGRKIIERSREGLPTPGWLYIIKDH
jgi:hypothetical protein